MYEIDYSHDTPISHRKKYAQFFTPHEIALLMCEWISSNSSTKTILEPAIGLGIFSRIFIEKGLDINIVGYDIDKKIYDSVSKIFNNSNEIKIILGDYMYCGWDDKYDGIICNPPYFKFQDYDNKSLIPIVEKETGSKLNGLTNLYALFLVKSLHQIKLNGRISYIIPSEFLNSDYGVQIKKHLLKTKMLRHVFIINSEENVFDDAITTSCILLFANDKNSDQIEFTNIKTIDDLNLIGKYISKYPNTKGEFSCGYKELDPTVKWRKYYQGQNSIKFKGLVPFKRYAKVVRGIATGDNNYFTFNNSKSLKYKIPNDALVPCICKSSLVKGNFFSEKHFNKHLKNDEMIFLFNGEGCDDLNVIKYIKYGEREGVNQRYLTKNRSPWYSLEKREPSPIWVSVFNRGGIKFVRNEAKIRNLTSFHSVYLKNNIFSSKISDDLFFAYLLTNTAKEIFNDSRREYGNGLMKFEPNDLNNSMMIDLSILSIEAVDDILKHYLKFKKSGNNVYLSKIDLILKELFST